MMVGPLAVVTAPFAAVVTYAVADGAAGMDITSLVGTVVTPVIVILLLLTGKLRTEGEVKDRDKTIALLRQQVTDKDAQVAALQASVVEKAIPALTRTALILEKLTPDVSFRER